MVLPYALWGNMQQKYMSSPDNIQIFFVQVSEVLMPYCIRDRGIANVTLLEMKSANMVLIVQIMIDII